MEEEKRELLVAGAEPPDSVARMEHGEKSVLFIRRKEFPVAAWVCRFCWAWFRTGAELSHRASANEGYSSSLVFLQPSGFDDETPSLSIYLGGSTQ